MTKDIHQQYQLFFVADVKCGLYEINKNNRANATHRPSPVQKMFWDRTEAMLDQNRWWPGLGPVLTLAEINS